MHALPSLCCLIVEFSPVAFCILFVHSFNMVPTPQSLHADSALLPATLLYFPAPHSLHCIQHNLQSHCCTFLGTICMLIWHHFQLHCCTFLRHSCIVFQHPSTHCYLPVTFLHCASELLPATLLYFLCCHPDSWFSTASRRTVVLLGAHFKHVDSATSSLVVVLSKCIELAYVIPGWCYHPDGQSVHADSALLPATVVLSRHIFALCFSITSSHTVVLSPAHFMHADSSTLPAALLYFLVHTARTLIQHCFQSHCCTFPAHFKHADSATLPATLLYCPGAHFKHADSSTLAATLLYFPGAQSLHADSAHFQPHCCIFLVHT